MNTGGVPWTALALGCALAAASRVTAGEAPAAGAAVYDRLGCAGCHAIAGVGNRRHPLDGVGSRLDAVTLRRWILEPATMKPGIRKPAYDQTPAADVEALVAYLASLKAK